MTPKPSEPQAELIKACPYRGLVPFSEDDADFFFGRQSDTQVIVANCLTTRVTLFYGASGVGKSSVLYAGVMRELHHRALANLARRDCPESVGVAFSSWRDDPVAGLIERVDTALRKLLPADWLPEMPPRAKTLAGSLRAWTEFMQSDLVLLLDQFEEYFLYRDAYDTAFADELVAVINDHELRVNVLISIREDALARLDPLKAKIPELFSNSLRLEHLAMGSARQAIEDPLKLYNERLPADAPRVSIEAELVGEVLGQVQAGRLRLRQAGAGAVRMGPTTVNRKVRVEAPYLQMVMMRLWREDIARGSQVLRLSTLEALGGAEKILRTHLDVVMEQLPAADQALASKVFHQLVTPSGTKIAHYVNDLAEFAEATPAGVAHMCELLEDWKARVLRDVTPPGAESKRYEIFHDLLAAPILDWRQRHVAELQRRAGRRKWGVRIGAAFSVCVLLAGWYIWRLEGEKNVAVESVKQLTTEKDTAVGSAKRLATEKGNVVESVRLLEQKLDRPEVREVIQQVIQNEALKATELKEPVDIIKVTGTAAPLQEVKSDGVKKFTTDKINSLHTRNVWNADYAALADSVPSGTGPDFLITSGSDRKAVVMDLKGDNDFFLTGHKDEVNVSLINPNRTSWEKGWFAATASDDNTARVWKFAPPHVPAPRRPFAELKSHTAALTGLAWSRNGRSLVTTSKDHLAIIWDVSGESPKVAKILDKSTESVWLPALVETANGSWLVTPSGDGKAYLYTFPEGKFLRELNHGAPVRRAALSRDGRLVVTGGADGRAVLWDRETGKLLVEAVHAMAVRDVAFDATGSHFVTGCADGSAQVWDTKERKGLVVLKGHTAPVFAVTFLPGGPGVVTTSWDRTACIWNFETKRCLAICTGHADVLWSVKCSPTGRSFCTTGGDGTTRLWDLKQISGTESVQPP